MTERGFPTPEDATSINTSPYPHLRTEPIVHPRQIALLKAIAEPEYPLPQGAEALLWEAIGEYDDVVTYRSENSGLAISTNFIARMQHDGEEDVFLAGKNHELHTRFQKGEDPVEPTDEIKTYVMVLIRDRNMEGARIWPDWVRYVPIDSQGNSKDIQYLIEVPDNLKGHNSVVELNVLNGTASVSHLKIPMKIR